MKTYTTVKGQIVIPAELRRKYGIKTGTKIIVTDLGDAILLNRGCGLANHPPGGCLEGQ